MSFHPKYCTIAYGISCLLDAADGHAARALNQTSKFGAVLDMVTDRCVSYKAYLMTVRPDTQGYLAGAQHLLFCAIYLPHTQVMLWCSSSSLPLILAVTTCTCTGMSMLLNLATRDLTPFASSLITGSRSHKSVTSDVSRILSLYYDPVSIHVQALMPHDEPVHLAM